ncbi:MAG TPA: Hsp20 family protein [Caulobacteraceae bacterium]|jgi:HSP20 family molecular chaperone IbpA
MSRAVYFDSPFLLGFEQVQASIDRAAKAAADAYPPYNVEDRGEAGIRISLAVAGFSAGQLEVTVENRQLTVAGRKEDAGKGGEGRAYLHRGIAARSFSRSFVLAEGIEVTEAGLEHGVLHIDLARPSPEQSVRRILVRKAD